MTVGKKKKVVDIVEEILTPFFEKEGYVLYHKEFVKEGPNWFLRVFIEKEPAPGGIWPENVTAQDCEIVSKYLSKELDIIDPIEQNYYLEISSPGMGRSLLKEEHYKRYEGHLVDVRLYKAIDGKKTIQGKILPAGEDVSGQKADVQGVRTLGNDTQGGGTQDEHTAADTADVSAEHAHDVRIQDEDGNIFELQYSQIAAANLTIVF